MKLWFHWNVSRFHLQFSFSHPLWRLDFSFIYYWRIKEDLMRSIVVHARVLSLKTLLLREVSCLVPHSIFIALPHLIPLPHFLSQYFSCCSPPLISSRSLGVSLAMILNGKRSEEKKCFVDTVKLHTQSSTRVESWKIKKIWAEKKKQKLQVFLSRFVFNFVSIVDHADFFS